MKKLKLYSVSTQSGNGTAAEGSASNPYTKEEYEAMLDNDTWPGGYVEGLGYCLKGVTVTPSSSNSGSGPWGSGSMFDYWSSMDSSYPWDSNPMDYLSSLYPSDTENGNGTWSGTGNSNSGNHNNGGGNGSHGGSSYNPYPQKIVTWTGMAWTILPVEGVGIKGSFNYQCTAKITGYKMFISASVNPINFDDRHFNASVRVNGGEFKQLTLDPNGYAVSSGWSPVGCIDIDLPKSGAVTITLYIGYDHDSGAGHANYSVERPIYPF